MLRMLRAVVRSVVRAIGLAGLGLALLFVVWLLEIAGEWEEWRETRR